RRIALKDVCDDGMAHRLCTRRRGSDRSSLKTAEPLDIESCFDRAKSRDRSAERTSEFCRRNARGLREAPQVCSRPPARDPGRKMRGTRWSLLRLSEYFSCVREGRHQEQPGFFGKASGKG